MVRTPGIALATPAASAPTWVCAVRVSFWIRPPRPDDRADRNGHHDQRQPQQRQADQRHGDHRADEDQRAGHRIHQAGGHHRPQQGGVRPDPGDQVTGAPGVEFADRQPQQPVHQQPPGVQHDALGGALQQVLLYAADHRGREHQRHQSATIPVSGWDSCTDSITRPTIGRLGDRQHGTDDRDGGDQQQHRPVRAQVRPQQRQPGPWARRPASRSTSDHRPIGGRVTITGSGSVRVALLTFANVIICRPVARHFLVRRNAAADRARTVRPGGLGNAAARRTRWTT